jgi:hypothetical protein
MEEVMDKLGTNEGKVYVVIPGEMGSQTFYKRDAIDAPIQIFTMNQDDWGNYGDRTRFKQCLAFIEGYKQIR